MIKSLSERIAEETRKVVEEREAVRKRQKVEKTFKILEKEFMEKA